ncbi:MAG TPA: SCO family protein [Polyangiaceae bacterium]|jgi:protein SCO1/2|nr:SCO family protein [Polyangiaceae bacterium]
MFTFDHIQIRITAALSALLLWAGASQVYAADEVVAAPDEAVAIPGAAAVEPDRVDAKPERLAGVDLKEQLGANVALEGQLIDSDGRQVRVADLFDGRHPVVLTLNYSNCPMLCGLQLPRFVEGLKQMTRSVGDEFSVLTISIDPSETPALASKTKSRYLADYGRPQATSHWHFLTGTQTAVTAIAQSVGISYGYNEARKEWLHPAAIVVLTPDGRVSRYLYGIQFDPETLNLALVEASEGKIGTVVDRLILYCFHYDESEGRYAPVAMNIMRVAAGLVAVVLAAFLATSWLVEARRRRVASPAQSPAS